MTILSHQLNALMYFGTRMQLGYKKDRNCYSDPRIFTSENNYNTLKYKIIDFSSLIYTPDNSLSFVCKLFYISDPSRAKNRLKILSYIPF